MQMVLQVTCAGQTTLLRFINAGLETHVPVLHGGFMDLIAEYGSPYPYPRKQYSFELAAGQSRDALFTPETAGRYAMYDRRLRLTNNMDPKGGLMSFLTVTAAASAPVATPDIGFTDEDTVIDIDIVTNDLGTLVPNSIHIPFQPANGLVVANNDGTVTYTPNANYNGVDTFSYTVNDMQGNMSNLAGVTITVNSINDAPIASDDTYNVAAGIFTNIQAPGIFTNDTDADQDNLTPQIQTQPSGGVMGVNIDGSFFYKPNTGTTLDTFTYVAFDGTEASNVATVTLNVESLAAATLISPTGNLGANNPPTYTWSAVNGATEYRVYIRNNTNGVTIHNQLHSTAEAVCDVATTCSLAPFTTPLATGKYTWRVRTENLAGVAWSSY